LLHQSALIHPRFADDRPQKVLLSALLPDWSQALTVPWQWLEGQADSVPLA
jgi:hypothetical protein